MISLQKAKDYLLLSILSYCNFTDCDCGRTIDEIFEGEDFSKIKSGNFYFCTDETKEQFYEYFKDILKKWKVFYVDNRTASVREKSSGFYSVVFKSEKKYIITFRGSEKYPVEDAYKDFVETDLSIGVGKRPRQFLEGVEVFNRLHRDFQIPIEDISVTGHSLGGGIAQFVALIADKEFGKVPYTCTWNSIGISREGIVAIEDFIDFDGIIKSVGMTDEEEAIFQDFKITYMNFLIKELKKNGAIKDNKTVLLDYDTDIYLSLEEEFLKNLSKNTNIDSCFSKVSPLRKHELIAKNGIYRKLFQMDGLGKLLIQAQDFMEKIRRNTSYEDNVINFCHSKDMTNELFPHVGSVYQVDLEFLKKDLTRKKFLKNFMFLTKSVQGYHFQDVFIPFVETDGDRQGMFSKKLSIEFIASLVRKLIALEYCFDREFLAEYYSLIDLGPNNYSKLKNYITKGISSCGEEILYKKQSLEQIKNMRYDEFEYLWKNLKDKLASPYRTKDLFDLIVFKR